MVEATAMPPVRQVKGAAERRFYSGMAIMMIVVMFLGFAPSFYLPGMITVPRVPPPLSVIFISHGVVMTLWFFLFLTQARLVAAGRRDLHMQLGKAGMLFAFLVLITMYFGAREMVRLGDYPPYATQEMWVALPLLALPQTAVLIFLAWYKRRDAQVHKRLILLSMLGIMEPAVGRLPIFPPTYAGEVITVFVVFLLFVPLFVWDWKSLGRIHKITAYGAGGIVAWHVFRFLIWDTAGWAAVARALT